MSHATKVINVGGIPNRFDPRIADLEKLNKVRSGIASFNLIQRIGQQKNLGNLEDLYKPLIRGQEKQLEEAKSTNVKLDEAKAKLDETKVNLSAQNEKLIKEIREQPLLIPLIKSLNDHPNLIKVIRGQSGDMGILTGVEQRMLIELNKIEDDRLLLSLINFYNEKAEIQKRIYKDATDLIAFDNNKDPFGDINEQLNDAPLNPDGTAQQANDEDVIYYDPIHAPQGTKDIPDDAESGFYTESVAQSDVVPKTVPKTTEDVPKTAEDVPKTKKKSDRYFAGKIIYKTLTDSSNSNVDAPSLRIYFGKTNRNIKNATNFSLLREYLIAEPSIKLDPTKSPWNKIVSNSPDFIKSIEYERGKLSEEEIIKMRIEEENAQGRNTYESITENKLSNDSIKQTLDFIDEKTGRKSLDTLFNYLVVNDKINIKKSKNPWKQVDSIYPGFVKAVKNARKHGSSELATGEGLTKFLPSNPNVLFKRLEVLLAEKKAGNNNVMEEATEIADELRRKGILSISQLRKIFKQFK
jgi:hypothetical protein